jgi:hypothetical protein
LFASGSISITAFGAGAASAEPSSVVSRRTPAATSGGNDERCPDGDEAAAEAQAAPCRRRRLEAERGVSGGEELAAGRIAVGLVFGQPLGKHGIERRIAAEPGRLFLHVRPQHLRLGRATKWRLPP